MTSSLLKSKPHIAELRQCTLCNAPQDLVREMTYFQGCTRHRCTSLQSSGVYIRAGGWCFKARQEIAGRCSAYGRASSSDRTESVEER